MIECIREMARRHYDIEVDVVRIQPTAEYEAALFDDHCDLIVEHLEFLYASAAAGAEATMFCAPVDQTGVELMVPAAVNDVSKLRGCPYFYAEPDAYDPKGVKKRWKGEAKKLLGDVLSTIQSLDDLTAEHFETIVRELAEKSNLKAPVVR